jgi:transposase-like protein
MAMLVVFSVTDPLGTHTMTKGSLITDWTLELRVPQDRLGRFSTELFERYQCSEKALVGASAEMYAAGVSTRESLHLRKLGSRR